MLTVVPAAGHGRCRRPARLVGRGGKRRAPAYADSFFVQLSASQPTLPVGGMTTLTAITGTDVGPTPWYIDIYARPPAPCCVPAAPGQLRGHRQPGRSHHAQVLRLRRWTEPDPPPARYPGHLERVVCDLD